MQSIQVRVVLALSAWLCAVGSAQSQFGTGPEARVLKGEIETGQPIVEGYTIELYSLERHEVLTTTDIRPGGEFEFRQTPYGAYLVTVTDAHGVAVYSGNLTVGGVSEPLVIRLRNEEISRPVSGTISVKQLQHPPTRKAFDAALAAQKLSEAGNFAGAVASLQKAVEISPDYADAWANLAAQHIRLGAYRQSVDESRRAIELAGPSTITLCNLAYAQLLLGRNSDAKASAEQALRLKPGDAKANYILGVILLKLHAQAADAAPHPDLASPTTPRAK